MTRDPRSAIHDDILSDYEVPGSDFTFRVLRAIPDQPGALGMPSRQRERRGRVALQTLAVVMVALIVAVVTIAVRTFRGDVNQLTGSEGAGLNPPAAAYFIADTQFVSADNAWIVAQLHVHNGPTVVMATTNGGVTWREQFRIPDGYGYDGLKFWNAREGALTEFVPSTLPSTKSPGAPGSSNMFPRTYRTHDGGAHWQLVDQPVGWTAIGTLSFFRTEQEGWRILPVFEAGKSGPMSSSLQHSTDGGATWSTIGAIPAGAGLNSQLSFSDEQTGWLTADGTQTTVSVTNGKVVKLAPPVPLWVTRDGGQSWAPIGIPLPAGAPDKAVQAALPVFFGSDGLLELDSEAGPGPIQTYIATTHDGGHTWSSPVLAPGGLPRGGVLFLGPQHWLISMGPKLSETTDGGKTWTTRQVLTDRLALDLVPWNYIDATTIWSEVGPDRLIRSTDGGQTWTSVVPPTINQ